MTSYDDARAAIAAAEQDNFEIAGERDAAIAELTEQRKLYDVLLQEFYDYKITHPDTPTTPVKTWLLGMSTEPTRWAERAAAVGRPVNVRRRFIKTWSVSGLVQLARDCHAVGCFPYISAKMSPNSWTQVAGGALDRDAEALGAQLAALGYPMRVTFHHEPRPASTAELVTWGQALTRLFTRMRTGAGNAAPMLILGPTDNGFPWGEGYTGGVKKTDLDTYYTDTLLDACDVLGADFYDGITDTNPGEAAWIKMGNFADYFDARGFEQAPHVGWKYDAGEYQVARAKDCDDLWTFLSTTPQGAEFNCLSIFNSSENNRPDLPSFLNGSWVLTGERLDAFRRMLAAADVKAIA